ncbi:hypothetical protein TW65_08645 [Stemphylium lycopersici]|uniref:Uncharacterized protein n=1 Tax=Stemphylium lycopersici TaxID=183478 RepID=A0A364MSE8_STELY|nr:hypothetical protein TW65_08645 [Stemphylium lycopersici]RAR01894.1 hypothetical protein DDE83_008764 [Stemphylium lycopersici]
MANNDDHNRTHHRPEDNPFIAFRRFTDSQVSSLLNTVFTLPATLANYNNAHHAREQCLFGKADQRQCDKLKDIEAGISELRNEGRELFRVGDVQAVLRNSEELMRLDRRADDIRREILGGSGRYVQHKVAPHDNGDIVERVANEKGQEWGWSWDWGFPRPFDHGHESSRGGAEEQTTRESTTPDSVSRTLGLVSELANAFEDWRIAAAAHADGQWDHPSYAPSSLETNPAMDAAGVAWIAAYQDLIVTEARERRNRKKSEGLMPGRIAKTPISQQQLEEAMGRDGEPTCPSSLQSGWLFQPKIPITQRQLEETLDRDAEPSCPRLAAQDEPSYEYSHDHEDQHDDPPTPRRKPNSFAQMLGLDHTAESENETAKWMYMSILTLRPKVPLLRHLPQ